MSVPSLGASLLPQRVASSKPKDVRVRVAVRVRPFLKHEISRGDENIIQSQDPTSLELWNYRYECEALRYTFDACYDEKATQSAIFHNEIKPMLRGPLQGQNTTCFAFGPTGAGKTHTMQGTDEDPGIIPLAIKELFFLLNADSSRYSYDVTMSYLEIYNEKVYDLLDPKENDLPIREDQGHNIVIPGLSEVSVHSLDEFQGRFADALLNRSTAPTKLNSRSSRSHAVLIIKIMRQEKTSPFRKLQGKVNLIDLAGSEDNRKTENSGARLKESGSINMSLFVLGKVVDALNEGAARIPYRDSKLTRLLQDSLGGDSRACIVANIAPSKHLYFDTYNSLNFASKSRNIVNRPVVHQTYNAPPPVIRTISITAPSSLPIPAPVSAPVSAAVSAPSTSLLFQPPSRLLAGTTSQVHRSNSSDKTTVAPRPVPTITRPPQSSVDDTLAACVMMTPSSKITMAKTYLDQAAVMMKMDKSKALSLFKAAYSIHPTRQIQEQISDLETNITSEHASKPSQIGTKTVPQQQHPQSQQQQQQQKAGKMPLAPINGQESKAVPKRPLFLQGNVNSPAKHKIEQEEESDDDNDFSPIRGKGRNVKRARLDDSDFIVASDEDSASDSSSPRIQKRLTVDFEVKACFEAKALPFLNSGDAKALMRLKGIGKKKAEHIVEFREANGPFDSIDDLIKVGFAEKGLEKLILDNAEGNFCVVVEGKKKKEKESKADDSTHSINVIQVDACARQEFELDTLNILNSGDLKTLMALNGLGKKRAERILEFRTSCGPFASILDLKKIGLFAEKGLDKFIKDNIRIDFVAQ